MPTRVTPYLGGTGQNNRNKLNVHPTLQSVTIGADVLGSANLNVRGNVHVSSNVETNNAFVSGANTGIPSLSFVGNLSGARWVTALGAGGFYWYNDTTNDTVPGASAITYRGATFNPKISFSPTGDINTAGRFATTLAQIRNDGLASFGTLTIPSLNTMAVKGNVYIDGNIFVTGNSFQILNNITAANANTVSANAFLYTKFSSDIPISNGVTFSGANVVTYAYDYPMISLAPSNNAWIRTNTTVIGQTVSTASYNPYQLVDDGLVVLHAGGRGNLLQTWMDGRAGADSRAWSLGITSVGALTWLSSIAPNTKPAAQRMSIDQFGNVLIGSGSTNASNLRVTGNVSISTNLIVGTNVIIGTPSNYSAVGLSDRLTLTSPQGTAQPTIPFAIVSGDSTSSAQRVWGLGVNQNQWGGLTLMVSTVNNTRANVNVMDFSRLDYAVTTNANLNVQGNAFITGDLFGTNFNKSNTLNDAAVQAACISRGWPMPVFGFIALPDVEPPANMVFSRTTEGPRINKYKRLENVPISKVRHTYDIDTGEYQGIDISGTAGKGNAFRWSNNLTVTGQIVMDVTSGPFTTGELLTDSASNTGILVATVGNVYAVSSGTGILNGTVTGNISASTGTVISHTDIWSSTNMVISANAVGLDGNLGTGTYLEATAANAEVSQGSTTSNGTRAGFVWLRKLQGTGNVYWSYNGSTWLPLQTRLYQNTFVLGSTFTEARIYGASGTNPTVRLRLEAAGDKVVIGNIDYNSSEGFFGGPIISNVTTVASVGSESMYFNIPNMLEPGKEFTVYMKAFFHNPGTTAYLLGLTNATSSTNNAASFLTSASEIYFRVNNNGTNYQTDDSTSRTMANGPQETSIVGRYREANSVVMYGNDRLYSNNNSTAIIASERMFTRLYLGKRTDASTTQSGNLIVKEVMIWPYAFDEPTMRLVGNGSKNAIPRPFVENAGEFAPVIQTLTKLKSGGTGTISIECVGDSLGAGASGTASWPKLLATYLDTTYGNSQTAVGFASAGSTNGPARSDLITVSFPSGSWTQTTRTKVAPNLSTSTTSSASGYMRFLINRALGTSPTVRMFYLTTADGQAEYSWDSGSTRYPLDLTVGTVGQVGYYDLANIISGTGELRIYRVSGTIELAGVNFTNTDKGVIIHKLCNISGTTKDWNDVDSTQWRVGYELINPTASIIMLGTYDQSASYNESAFSFYLQNMINRRRATVPYRPIMIVMPPDNRRANTSPMDFYSKEARRIAALNNCTFVDLQWMFGNSVAEYDLSWWSDTIIPNTNEGGPALVAGILRALESSAT